MPVSSSTKNLIHRFIRLLVIATALSFFFFFLSFPTNTSISTITVQHASAFSMMDGDSMIFTPDMNRISSMKFRVESSRNNATVQMALLNARPNLSEIMKFNETMILDTKITISKYTLNPGSKISIQWVNDDCYEHDIEFKILKGLGQYKQWKVLKSLPKPSDIHYTWASVKINSDDEWHGIVNERDTYYFIFDQPKQSNVNVAINIDALEYPNLQTASCTLNPQTECLFELQHQKEVSQKYLQIESIFSKDDSDAPSDGYSRISTLFEEIIEKKEPVIITGTQRVVSTIFAAWIGFLMGALLAAIVMMCLTVFCGINLLDDDDDIYEGPDHDSYTAIEDMEPLPLYGDDGKPPRYSSEFLND